MVGDPVLRIVVGADLLGAVAAADHPPAFAREVGVGPFALELEESGPEHPQRLGLVLDLAALVLAGDDEPGRQVGETHRRVGRVHPLSAGSRGAVGVDPQIALLHLDLDLFGLRQHGDRGGRGMDPPRGLGDRHALHAVDPPFVLEAAVRPFALDDRRELLDPAGLGLREVDQLHPPPLPVGVAAVHAEELGGEERGLVAAGAGADLEHHVAAVVRILRGELAAQLGEELLPPAGEPRRLVGGERRELRLPRALAGELGGFGELALDPSEIAVELDGASDLGERLARLAVETRVAQHLRRGEAGGELGVGGDELLELLAHLGGSAGGVRRGGRRAAAQAVVRL